MKVALTTTAVRVLVTLATLSTAFASRHQRDECLSSCSSSSQGLKCYVNASDFRADCLEGNVRFLFVEGLPREDGDLTPTPSIRLDPSFFGNAPSLGTIVFSRIRISELDPSTFFAFPELTALHLAETGLQQLPEDLLSRAPELWIFDMPFNDVTSLPEKLFSRNPSLVWVNLSRNRLTALRPGLFVNKTELRWLYLSSNSLTALPEDAFEDNPNLKVVDLRHNRLTSVSSETFARNRVNGWLSLEGNPLPCDCPFKGHVTRLSEEKGWRVQLPEGCETKMDDDCSAAQRII